MTRDSDATPIPWGARAMRSSASLRGVRGGLGLRQTRFEKRIPSVYRVRECTFHGTVVRTKRCRGPDDFGGKIFDKTKNRSNPFFSSIRSSSCRGRQLFGRPRIQSTGAYTLHTRTMGVVGRDNYHQPADICLSPRGTYHNNRALVYAFSTPFTTRCTRTTVFSVFFSHTYGPGYARTR